VTVLLYADLRMRREGLDAVLRAAAASGVTGPELDAAWLTPPSGPAQPGR